MKKYDTDGFIAGFICGVGLGLMVIGVLLKILGH